jgi:hypothetical protein
MSETPISMNCVPINIDNNNIETFVSEDLLVPTSKDVIALNRFFLETDLEDSSSDSMNKIPHFAGPSNVAQPKMVNMPTMGPHTLKDPIRISLPDGVVPDSPFILLDKPLGDNNINKCNNLKTPEDIVTIDLLNQAQNINNLSVENGLPVIPVYLNNKDGYKDTNVVNNDLLQRKSVILNMPPSNNSIAEELPGYGYNPIKFKVDKGCKRRILKKILMWVSIALIIYLIVLLFKK